MDGAICRWIHFHSSDSVIYVVSQLSQCPGLLWVDDELTR